MTSFLDRPSVPGPGGPPRPGDTAPRPGVLTPRSGPVHAEVPAPRQEHLSVLLADGHGPRREATAREMAPLGAVHEAGTVAEATAAIARAGDLAVVDLVLPGGDVLELVGELRTRGWSRIVVVGGSDDPGVVRAAFEAGAHAYLRAAADSHAAIIDAGWAPEPGVGPEAGRTGTRVTAADGTPAELSAREAEVLALVADGRSNKQIGDTLGLSALTVKSHLSRIGRKFGTGDRAQMVALAMRAGVVR